jgi:hypothetical protein
MSTQNNNNKSKKKTANKKHQQQHQPPLVTIEPIREPQLLQQLLVAPMLLAMFKELKASERRRQRKSPFAWNQPMRWP